MRDKEFGVVGSAAQKRGILEEKSEPGVALPAEESAHHAGFVRVIDTERPLPLPAHGAQAALALQHAIVVLQRQSVSLLQLLLPPALLCPEQLGAVLGIGRVALSLLRVELFAIGRVPAVILGKRAGAISRILRISLALTFARYSHWCSRRCCARLAASNG
jgi:hypothetical protein